MRDANRGTEPVGRFLEVVIDVSDLERGGAFWMAVLGVESVGGDHRYLWLKEQPGALSIILQRVTEPKAGKNRVHVDLRVDDLDAALARVEALGGRKVRYVEEPGERFIVVADPDGNEFCLVPESFGLENLLAHQ